MSYSDYKNLLSELLGKIQPSGWQDKNLGDFLDFRDKLFQERSKDPKSGKINFFNLMTYAAQQKYPELVGFAHWFFAGQGQEKIKALTLTGAALDFFAFLRETRRKNESDVEAFLDDVDEEHIDQFLQKYEVPSNHLITPSRFKEHMQRFPDYRKEQNLTL